MGEKNKSTLTAEKIECINKIVDKWLGYQLFIKRIPGMSVGIIHKDKIVLSKGYGYANLEKKQKATEKTNYRIASISKLFTAISIMQLVEKDKINLDDEIGKYFDWPEDKAKKITIKQLLTHSSGMDRDGDTPHWNDDNFPDLETIKKHVSKDAITYTPSHKFKYSNLGFALLGRVIEKTSGISYSDYVNKNILKKLNMGNTFVDYSDNVQNLAQGYGRDFPSFKREEFTSCTTKSMESAAGFVSNIEDLCKFISAQFTGSNIILSEKSKKEMQEIHWKEKTENDTINWGLGFEIWKVNKKIIRGHGGGFPGFITNIGFDKDKEIGVIVLTNCLGGDALELSNSIFKIINYIDKNFDNFKSEKNIDVKKFEGRFYQRWEDIDIVEINNSLNFYYPSSPNPINNLFKLKHIKENTFKIETGDNFDYIGENVSFEFDESGSVKNVKIGPNTLIPFEEFKKALKA